MNTAVVGSEAVELLSRITGQKLSQRDLTPPVVFLASLITLLLGVVFADGTVTDDEKQRLQATLNRFNLPEGAVRQLAKLMLTGVQQQKVYRNIDDLVTLTAPLSEPERLLLISFGYQMSVADGNMDAREQRYLQAIANRLGINPRYLAVLETGLSQGTIDPAALMKVHSLLDPARFHSLDTIFVNAASDILAALPAKPEHQGIQQHRATSCEQLKEFQKYRQQLDSYCFQISLIIQACKNRDFLPHTLTEEIEKVYRKLKSQRFRVAVVGDFSQGKSTLLNALLREKIQPVRAIPCSGTVTVLKHGAQRRVVCRYKDGRQEEIPFEQYQVKAAMSKEAARNPRSELARSDIDEIIFEHPDLEFCRNGVEIVDSPGLNEHPDRTAVTQKLVRDTDAVIFLANAQRLLTEKEQELLQDLRIQLNGGNKDKPATNLFVVVNFMDMLDDEDDRQDVLERTESIVKGKNPIITDENRIHFISAKAALNAILKRTEDEYLKSFQSFTQSIEKFLTIERGYQEIKQSATKIKGLIQSSLDGLHQAEKVLDGKLKLSEAENQKILEQIGEASGRDVRIRLVVDQLVDEVIEQVNESWNAWIDGLADRLAEKIEQWSSVHSAIFSREQLAKDYASQFNKYLSSELDGWIENQLKQAILKPHLEILDNQIRQEIQVIKSKLDIFNEQTNTKSPNWVFYGQGKYDFAANVDILGNYGLAGLGAAVLIPAIVFAGPILAVIAGICGGGLLVGGLGGILGLDAEIRAKAFESGWQQFVDSIEGIFEKINEMIGSAFYERVALADEVIGNAISIYEIILEQQEKAHQETLEQCEVEKAWIAQKRQELEQVQSNIEAILNQCAG